MKLATRADAIMHLKQGWIVEGSNNVHLTFVRVFNWPGNDPVSVPKTGVFCLAWTKHHVETRVYPCGEDLDIYQEPMVGGKTAFTVLPTKEDLSVKALHVFDSDGTQSFFVGENFDEVGDAMADVFFDEDETIMTLTQFKAQSGYVKVSTFLQEAEKRNQFIITY